MGSSLKPAGLYLFLYNFLILTGSNVFVNRAFSVSSSVYKSISFEADGIAAVLAGFVIVAAALALLIPYLKKAGVEILMLIRYRHSTGIAYIVHCILLLFMLFAQTPAINDQLRLSVFIVLFLANILCMGLLHRAIGKLVILRRVTNVGLPPDALVKLVK